MAEGPNPVDTQPKLPRRQRRALAADLAQSRPRRPGPRGWLGKGRGTAGLPRDTPDSGYNKQPRQGFADHAPGDYQRTVETARAAFARGDLFEAVPGQLFAEPCERSPAEVF
jgi:anthranilate/para-aminobenzoate synthase component I